MVKMKNDSMKNDSMKSDSMKSNSIEDDDSINSFNSGCSEGISEWKESKAVSCF